MQTSRIHNALHPFISFLAAPIAEQGQCKTSSYSARVLNCCTCSPNPIKRLRKFQTGPSGKQTAIVALHRASSGIALNYP